VIGLFGGAFDPPHLGHVELARCAKATFGLPRLVVLVSAAPGHKPVDTPVEQRLALVQAAFPDDEVTVDPHPRTVDLLRAHPEWVNPIFLVGADQLLGLPDWKEPAEVLRLTRLGVATRPGFPREQLEAVLARLERPERVLFFEIEPTPVASSELRDRLMRGEDVSAELPSAVAAMIERDGLYGG
jgi:nicotinate-nucleotide adenylyltransferase